MEADYIRAYFFTSKFLSVPCYKNAKLIFSIVPKKMFQCPNLLDVCKKKEKKRKKIGTGYWHIDMEQDILIPTVYMVSGENND